MSEDALKREVDEIRVIVHKLDVEKQNRIKPSVVVSIATAFVAVVFYAGVQLATLSTNLRALTVLVESGTNDRYRGSQAQQDFKLRDQRDDFLQEQINQMKQGIQEHKARPCHDKACIEIEKLKLHELNGSR